MAPTVKSSQTPIKTKTVFGTSNPSDSSRVVSISYGGPGRGVFGTWVTCIYWSENPLLRQVGEYQLPVSGPSSQNFPEARFWTAMRRVEGGPQESSFSLFEDQNG